MGRNQGRLSSWGLPRGRTPPPGWSLPPRPPCGGSPKGSSGCQWEGKVGWQTSRSDKCPLCVLCLSVPLKWKSDATWCLWDLPQPNSAAPSPLCPTLSPPGQLVRRSLLAWVAPTVSFATVPFPLTLKTLQPSRLSSRCLPGWRSPSSTLWLPFLWEALVSPHPCHNSMLVGFLYLPCEVGRWEGNQHFGVRVCWVPRQARRIFQLPA